MIEAAFETARRLFGLTFTPVGRAALSSRRARLGGDGRAAAAMSACSSAIISRARSKHSGAWMTSLRDQEKLAGDVRRSSSTSAISPSRPRASRRCCRSTTRARCSTNSATRCTACCRTSPIRCSPAPRCRAISSNCRRSSTSTGWRCRRSCRHYARHARTGEPMPKALLDRLLATRTFNQGFATVEYTACALVDLDLHALPDASALDVADFERTRSRAHRHAGGDRHAPPPAAFPASVLRRRLCGRLLLLHVVGGARRRRLRGLRGNRRRLRSGDRQAPARLHLRAPATCAIRPRPTKPSAAACRRSMRC